MIEHDIYTSQNAPEDGCMEDPIPTVPQPIFQMGHEDQHEKNNTKTRSNAPQVRTIQSDYTSKTS